VIRANDTVSKRKGAREKSIRENPTTAREKKKAPFLLAQSTHFSGTAGHHAKKPAARDERRDVKMIDTRSDNKNH